MSESRTWYRYSDIFTMLPEQSQTTVLFVLAINSSSSSISRSQRQVSTSSRPRIVSTQCFDSRYLDATDQKTDLAIQHLELIAVPCEPECPRLTYPCTEKYRYT